MSEKERIHCPFCGPFKSVCEALDADVTYGGGKPYFKVFCGACGSSSGLHKSEAEAVEAWVRHEERSKELLKRFITYVRNHWAVNAVIDGAGMVEAFLRESK